MSQSPDNCDSFLKHFFSKWNTTKEVIKCDVPWWTFNNLCQIIYNSSCQVLLYWLVWLSSSVNGSVYCVRIFWITKPKNFDAIFSGFLGMYCTKLHLPRNESNCSSIVRYALGVITFWQFPMNISQTYLKAASLSVWARDALVRRSSNLITLLISSNLFTDIVALYRGFCFWSKNSSLTGTSQLFSTPARSNNPKNALISSTVICLQVLPFSVAIRLPSKFEHSNISSIIFWVTK